MEGFLQFPLNERHEQYFTLFDFIEDDLFDGTMGVDDEELPMVQLRYHVTDSPLSRTSYENRKEETVVTITKTSTKKEAPAPTPAAQMTSSTEPVVRDANLESSDAYSVKTLTTDLRNGLNQLVDELKAEQSDIFNYENARADQLAHLEKVHRELEQEHINDQVSGEELKRLQKEIASEISIAKSGIEDDKQSLARSIAHTDEQLKEKDPLLKAKQAANADLNKTLSQDEQSVYRTPQAATDLRKGNDDARKRMEDAAASVRKEREDKAAVFNQHADLVNQYNDLVARYEKLLLDAEGARRDAERDANATTGEISAESAEGANLEHYVEATNKSSGYHQNQVSALRKDLESYTKHYGSFVSQLDKFVHAQNDEAERLRKSFDDQGRSIAELQGQLSESVQRIVGLHAEVDKNNAANLNAKLSTLIGTLVDVDKTRRESQNALENSQENWSYKVRTFLDEAARASRENANKKRAKEVENLLHKLDRLNRERNEIARERDAMEAKVVTDRNRDAVNENSVKELDSLNLKLRWANDEIVKTDGDLQEVLGLLATKKGFITEQEEQIRSLKEELTTLIRQRIETGGIEDVIRALDDEIARLRAEIDELNRKIAELEAAIAEKDAEIEELNKMLKDRLNRIKELQAALKGSSYVAVKGDLVDEMLAQYIQNCPVPVKRLGGGFYLFGLKKIFAKILNGKLVIRVGGGYMVIEKFIETYAEQELSKLKKVAEREGVASFMDLDLEMIALGPKVPLGNSPTGKSPTGKSPRTSFNASGSINGTNRKTFTGSPKAIVRATGATESTVVTTEKIKKQA